MPPLVSHNNDDYLGVMGNDTLHMVAVLTSILLSYWGNQSSISDFLCFS